MSVVNSPSVLELEVTCIDLLYLKKLKYQQDGMVTRINILFVAVGKAFHYSVTVAVYSNYFFP